MHSCTISLCAKTCNGQYEAHSSSHPKIKATTSKTHSQPHIHTYTHPQHSRIEAETRGQLLKKKKTKFNGRRLGENI